MVLAYLQFLLLLNIQKNLLRDEFLPVYVCIGDLPVA